MARKALLAVLILAGACAAAQDELAKETVTLTTSDNVQVSGYFVKAGQDTAPAVVLLHMLGRTKEDWDSILRQYLLKQTPFSYLAIDLRGHGQSVTRGEMKLGWRDFKAEKRRRGSRRKRGRRR